MEYEDLMNRLKFETNVFQGRGIEQAFRAVDRQDFLEEDYKPEAYEDYAVPLSFGSSLTQPTTLAFMLELLDVQPGDAVLDVGSGSGFSTALLSILTGEKGTVIGVEIIPELLELSKKNLEKYKLPNVIVEKGYSKRLANSNASYDRILVNADSEELPLYIFNQLKVGGSMVVPIDGVLTLIEKTSTADWEEKEFEGFTFVSLQ